ncbi:centriolar coiled-coil protein of 110 kDa isoform X2 [Eublepharis macularius]|uniref:Centriolar coiled-coil protein of 110 kDa isoform X2 n=1 Tax=Eublepharis macularius TaxID=481883 RepID=A0AA97KAA9_EUBMA|nr:centriolar coiled-coil protein of 110 kDa isoform X2 [Eublepharis macularius]
MEMEDYETFCAKHLARLQGELLQGEMPPVAQHNNVSLIQFHGVPVLPPLLSLERKKEIHQDRQKALNFELWRQNSRKRILLNRVQEILENVQMKKLSSPSDLGPSGMEKICSDLEPQVFNGFVTESNSVLPSSTAPCGSTEPQKILEAQRADNQVVFSGNSLGETEQLVPDKQKDVCPHLSEKKVCPESSFAIPSNLLPSNETAKQENVEMVSAAVEAPDPYVMSLQNLLKKSREYIQREQTRRSMRSGSKRSVSESLSDKENDAVKMSDSMKERGKLMGRSYTPATLDKPNLTSLQGNSVPKNSTRIVASPSFSKVDIPMRSGTPPVRDSDSDEDFKNTSLFDHDSSILRSLTGSYSKLPSPEPSMSPKMHRRRPRPSSMGHIVINNPINAYELSPKEKGRAVGLIGYSAGDKTFASDPVPKLTPDFAPVCSSKTHAFHKSASDISDESVAVKPNQVCQLQVSQQESGGFPASTVARGGELMTLDGRGASTTCFSAASLQEPPAVSSPIALQNAVNAGGAKQVGLPDKAKCSAATELNKSYDVESPSPLLMQTQHSQQTDTPNAGNEQSLENGFEKVKRRLELDADGIQKENVPSVMGAGTSDPEKRWSQDPRGPAGPASTAKNETHGRGSREEEALRIKMLALEEMRKRLEEQHAQQLSLLIAEQEREQERLQKEIIEQERRLKGEKTAVAGTEIPPIAISCGVDLEWRKMSDPRLLESVLTQVETLHNANSESAGFVNAKLGSVADSPFYLWEPPPSGKSVSATRSVNRSKMRWSQVYSPEMKRKLNKISALAKGFLTRRLLQTEKLKHLRQTVKDTMEFMRNFQSEAPLKRGNVSAQDASLQERVAAQLRAALYEIHDIFFKVEVSERMNILRHDREVRKEKMLRQLDKAKTPKERVTLSTATQKSLDRKKCLKATEIGMSHKKTIVKQKTPENRVLQPNQGQNAPIQRLLSRQGTPKTSVKGAEQNIKKPSESSVSNKARSGVCARRIQRKKPSAVTT